MNIKKLFIIILIIIFSILSVSCGNNNDSENINRDTQKTYKQKDVVEDNKSENKKNNSEIPNEKEINTTNSETDDDSNIDSGIKELQQWLENYHHYLLSFSKKELEEQEFIQEGRNYFALESEYRELYSSLNSIKKAYNDKVGNPPSNLNDKAYKALKACKEHLNTAMNYRIKALHNMMSLIENIGIGGDEYNQAGAFTDPNLSKYQENTKRYDAIIKNIIKVLKSTLYDLGYELNFKTGELNKIQ